MYKSFSKWVIRQFLIIDREKNLENNPTFPAGSPLGEL